MKPYWSHLQGVAGEYRVAAELALRGIMPNFPGRDFGYDLMIEGGVRVQVKSAKMRRDKNYPLGAYWFRFRKSTGMGHGITRSVGGRKFSEECDFVVLWGIETNRFWIVPAEKLDGVQCLVLGQLGPTQAPVDFNKINDLRWEGNNIHEIAKELDVHIETVRNYFNRKTGVKNNERMSKHVRQYENRWDLLDVNAVAEELLSEEVSEETSVEKPL